MYIEDSSEWAHAQYEDILKDGFEEIYNENAKNLFELKKHFKKIDYEFLLNGTRERYLLLNLFEENISI